MAGALQRHCGDVSFIGPLHSRTEWAGQWLDRWSQRLLGKRYDHLHSTLVSRRFGRMIAQRLSRQPFDVIFAPAASTEIAYLQTAVPIVYLSDATFALVHDYYPQFSNLLNVSIWEGHRIERLAIGKARAALYATGWAARSAQRDYGADPAKVVIAPFGANLDEVPDRRAALAKDRSDRCRLLFLGTDWERKGGAVAFDTLVELEDRGVKASLVVCGCNPPKHLSHPGMTVVPFLDKNVPAHRRTLTELMSSTDFLLLPTRAECSGIVFCEANAFGVPVVTTDTGGVSDVVKSAENGLLLPLTARGPEYAELIKSLWTDPIRYAALAESSRDRFEIHMTWDAWGATVSRVIESVVRGAVLEAMGADRP
jgi:glycosyltransferase involved in cell wall biosynthesis